MQGVMNTMRQQVQRVGLASRKIDGQIVWPWDQGAPPLEREKRLQEVAKEA